MWGRFFDSIGAPDDTESAISGSNMHLDPNTPARFAVSPLPGVTGSPQSEVHPNDSASVGDEEQASDIEPVRLRRAADAPGASSIGGASLSLAAAVPIDDGTYVFKFRTPGGRTHRFQARTDNVENLRDIVAGKLATDPFFIEWKPVENGPPPDPLDFHLQYTDADGDTVVMSSDSDVSDAVKIARDGRADRVVLIIQGGKGWNEVGASQGEVKVEAAAKEVKEAEKTEAAPAEGVGLVPPPKVHTPLPATDDILGVPRDLVLPASIGALAVVIIGIFTISRMMRD